MNKYKYKSEGREFAFRMMYRLSITDETVEHLNKTFWDEVEDGYEKEAVKFSETLLRLAMNKMELSDTLVKKFLKENWTFDRLGDIEKNLFRVAIPELLDQTSPYYAVINDFVGIAKKYADDKCASLVNGLLDKIRKEYAIGSERENGLG